MDFVAVVEDGPFNLLHYLHLFWYEVLVVEFWALHLLAYLWVGYVLLGGWLTEVIETYW